MSRALEIFYLPSLFLTVALLGGMRVTGRVVFVPPPLASLVLSLRVVGVLIRSGALAPQRLMHSARTAIANINGAVVVFTLFAAAVQVFNCVIPEAGLPHVIVIVFLAIMILNTFAAAPDRTHVLRSAAVVLGSTFVLKFIVLSALSEPGGGWLKRVLLAALEGVTVGTLTQPVLASTTGYVGFFTVVLFLVGLALLPPALDERVTAHPSNRTTDIVTGVTR